MVKKLFLLTLLILVSAFPLMAGGQSEQSGSAGDQEQTDAPIVFRMAHEDIADTVPDNYCKEFGRRLEERTNGRVKVEVYPVGQLGVGVELVEQLLTGGIDMVIMNPGNTGTLVPEAQLFLLHFLLPANIEKSFEFMENSKALNENLNELYLAKNMYVIDWWSQGMMQWTTNKRVTSPTDFEGMKIRTMQAPLILENYKAYGANPTPVPYTEVYSAMQLNMVDGHENPIGPIEEMKFYEVQDHIIRSNHFPYMLATILNNNIYQSLPADIQTAIEDIAGEMHSVAYDLQLANNKRAEDKIKDDIEIVDLTQAQIEEFRQAAVPVRDYYVNSVGPKGKEIMDLLVEEMQGYR